MKRWAILMKTKDYLCFLQDRQPLMIEQLHQFCEINSGTENLIGLEQVKQRLNAAFAPVADQIETRHSSTTTTFDMNGQRLQKYGDLLFIRKRPALKRRVLLCGHMDTVYSAQHPFQTLTYVNDNQITGPGVADMKGGLIVLLHALNAFEHSPQASKLGWDVLINADEEVGSPASGPLLNELAHHYQAALVYEPSMTENGCFAKNRKGSGKLTLIATGRAAHVGRSFHEGRNAIAYLAKAVLAMIALNEQRHDVTINVGHIAGGGALNVVPDRALAQFDVRITQPEDEQWVMHHLNQIINQMQEEHYTLTLHGHFGRPVKRVSRATERLFTRIQHLGHELGLPIDWNDSGGCCDGNNLAYQGLPVIDTLGVRGGQIHSPHEFIILDSLVERAALSTFLLLDLAQGGLEELQK